MNKKIEESLYTLHHINNQIDLLFKAVLEINSNLKVFNPILSKYDESITFGKVAIPGLLQNIYILSNSFLDEWKDEFTQINYPNHTEKILRLKTITKPAFNKINEWSGLKKLRNSILAHNLRVKGESIFVEGNIYDFKFPISNTETILLVRLISIISEELYNEFSEIDIDVDKTILGSLNIPINHIDVNKEIEGIALEMDKIRKSK